MEKTWNNIHATIFYFALTLFNLFTKIDPFNYLFKIPFIKTAFAKRGIEDPNKLIDDIAFRNRETGWLSTWASIQMGGLLVLIEFSLFNFLQAAIGKSLLLFPTIWGDSLYRWIFIIGLLIIPGIINYRLLWKNDKYLKYFKKFEKEPKNIKRKWAWITLGVVLGILGLFVLSLCIFSLSVFGRILVK